jgi:hypothetical protein
MQVKNLVNVIASFPVISGFREFILQSSYLQMRQPYNGFHSESQLVDTIGDCTDGRDDLGAFVTRKQCRLKATFEQSMENAYMTRLSNETPIKGLYLAGAWGKPGGGYPEVLRSGQLTFEKLMESWGGKQSA